MLQKTAFKNKYEWNRNTKRKTFISRKKTAKYWWFKVSIIIWDNIIIEHQKITNLLGTISNQPSKFKTKIGLKQMMIQEEYTILIVKVSLKIQC